MLPQSGKSLAYPGILSCLCSPEHADLTQLVDGADDKLFQRILTNYKNKNWLQFLFIVKAAVLKPQISKFYPQIQRTEASDHIYFSQRPFINVKAIFCA